YDITGRRTKNVGDYVVHVEKNPEGHFDDVVVRINKKAWVTERSYTTTVKYLLTIAKEMQSERAKKQI
ncbi:MAG: hypothetical protein PHU12_04270, partial [Candidatus Aenigmarchaeota archaeon]|nr:hypothetical protein [Candidatus Aenigmarchaeota archaeon]